MYLSPEVQLIIEHQIREFGGWDKFGDRLEELGVETGRRTGQGTPTLAAQGVRDPHDGVGLSVGPRDGER